MSVRKTASRRRAQHLASVMLLSAGAAASGLLGNAPSAHAADDYEIFLATGEANQTPPVQTVGGLAIGLEADRDQAYQIALSNCVKHGGHQCVVVVSARNACAAVATNDFGQTVGASEVSLQNAQSNATRMLDNKQGARIVVSGCANGFVPTSNPPPAAPRRRRLSLSIRCSAAFRRTSPTTAGSHRSAPTRPTT